RRLNSLAQQEESGRRELGALAIEMYREGHLDLERLGQRGRELAAKSDEVAAVRAELGLESAAEPAPAPIEPATAEPVAGEPATAEPAAGEPETAEPAAGEPETAEPATGEPETAEPQLPDPGPDSSFATSSSEETAERPLPGAE